MRIVSLHGLKKATALLILLALITAQSVVSLATAQKHAKAARLTEDQRIVHVLNRLGFGARPGDVERVKALGLEKYINQQLNPEKIDDAVADNKIKDLTVMNMTTAELYEKFPQPGQLLRQLQARGALPVELAEARDNRVKGGANSAPAERPRNDSMTAPEMGPDGAPRNNQTPPA